MDFIRVSKGIVVLHKCKKRTVFYRIDTDEDVMIDFRTHTYMLSQLRVKSEDAISSEVCKKYLERELIEQEKRRERCLAKFKKIK